MRACWVSSRSTASTSEPCGRAVSAVSGSGTAGSLGGAQRLDGVRAFGFEAVLVAVLFAVQFDDLFAGWLLVAVQLLLHPLEAFVGFPHVSGAEGGQVELG